MKRTCLIVVFLFMFCLGNTYVNAQKGSDTTFTFYYNTAEYKTEVGAQKDFKTFLSSIQSIKSIRGYTDTVGQTTYNKKLAQRRAVYIHQLLPITLQNEKLIAAEGETSKGAELWQNRRVDIMAVKKVAIDFGHSIIKDTVAELNIENILFIPDQPFLTETSFAYVKALAQQLQQYPTQKFQIIGHVNYPSRLPAERLKDLYALSEARAKTVYNLLVQNGIEASRMTYSGVGNSQPVYPEPVNDEQKRANMRVQVLILRN